MKEQRIESVGWIFFGVMVLLFVPLGVYVLLKMTHDSVHIGTRVGTGVFFGFMVAGFTSWLANSILFYRAQRLAAKEAPPEKTQKRKKHKQPK